MSGNYPSGILSKRLAVDGIIFAGNCKFYGFTVLASTGPGKVLLYDNASGASGTVIGEGGAAVTGDSFGYSPPRPVDCANGIYADVTTANVIVYYATPA